MPGPGLTTKLGRGKKQRNISTSSITALISRIRMYEDGRTRARSTSDVVVRSQVRGTGSMIIRQHSSEHVYYKQRGREKDKVRADGI